MGEGQLSLSEQLHRFYQGMQNRMAPADLEALRLADQEMADAEALRTMPQPGDIAPGFSLLNQNGVAVSLAARLALGPVVLLFVRGGWCPRSASMSAAWWRSATCWPIRCCPTLAASCLTATAS